MSGRLYVVATPIGNREDITERARRVLGEVDIIAAEDTRTTQVLLHMLDIKGKTVSNHKFNERKQVDYLLGQLLEGKSIAVVSDAGTPCISDPGGVLVEAAAQAGIEIEGVSGASAVVTALSISGFRFTEFAFHGFLPRSDKEIRESFERAKSGVAVNVFFESPNRIKHTLALLGEVEPASRVCLCNDLTKKHERHYRGAVASVLAELEENPNADKGEYTMVVEFPPQPESEAAALTEVSDEALIVDYMLAHDCSAKAAVNELAANGVRPKKALYAASLRLKELFE